MGSNGCFIAVFIARTHDHVPLCVYADDNYRDSDVVRKQTQLILERMDTPASRGVGPGSHANGSHYQSFDHKDCIYFAFQDAATDLTVIAALNKLLLRNSSGDVASMNKLACGLLDMVFAEFIQAYRVSEFGAPGVRPYQFIRFETVVQKCVTRVIQQDRASKDSIVLSTSSSSGGGGSSAGGGGSNGAGGGGGGSVAVGGARRQVNPHYEAIRQELTDVHMVMRKNLEELMKRGEKLETMNSYSSQLVDQSSRYYKRTVRLNRTRWLKLYGPPIVVCLLLVLFLYMYLF